MFGNTFQLSFNHLIWRPVLMERKWQADFEIGNTNLSSRGPQQQLRLHNLNAITLTINRIWINFGHFYGKKMSSILVYTTCLVQSFLTALHMLSSIVFFSMLLIRPFVNLCTNRYRYKRVTNSSLIPSNSIRVQCQQWEQKAAAIPTTTAP